MRKIQDIDERFWSKVREQPNGCLLWVRAVDQDGYGMFQVSGRVTRRAHKWIYERMVGPVPPGKHVCHRCDTPACVNYKRCLFVGTVKENNRDRDLKGRQSRGEAHYAAKVTSGQVAEMRARKKAGEKVYRFHKEYGLSYSQAKAIVSGRKWKP